MATKISIYRDGVWAGSGVVDMDGEIVCDALLGDTQDDSDATYEAISDALDAEPQGDGRYAGEGSVTRPDGEYTWTVRTPTGA